MKQPLVAIYDKKIGLYDKPVVVRHVGEAIREFEKMRKDTNTKFGSNPEDFDMFQIGFYDDELGSFETLKPAVHLLTGVQ